MASEASEPCSWSLTETVQGAREETDVVGAGRVLEVGWLLAEDALGDVAVQERVGDVELVGCPALGGDDCQDGANCGRLDNRGEGFAEVDPLSLMEATHDPSGFVAFETAIGAGLVFEHPLARDDAGIVGTWNESPGPVVLKGVELLAHGVVPVRVAKCSADRRRYG